MTKEELLQLIRQERPNQVIHEVKGFAPSRTVNGLYNVLIDAKGFLFETQVEHMDMLIPYPLSVFLALPLPAQMQWRIDTNNNKYE